MSKNIIVMNRGDSYTLILDVAELLDLYSIVPTNTDAIYFGVMDADQPFEQAIIKKKFLGSQLLLGKLYIDLIPSDTLDLLPDLYHYSVKFCRPATTSAPQIVHTIVPKTKFYLND